MKHAGAEVPVCRADVEPPNGKQGFGILRRRGVTDLLLYLRLGLMHFGHRDLLCDPSCAEGRMLSRVLSNRSPCLTRNPP